MSTARKSLTIGALVVLTAASMLALRSHGDVVASVDHLVYATPELNRGVNEIENLIGIRPSAGGQHLGRGTWNALLALGPGAYLEIIAADPQQSAPAQPRLFGLDTLTASRLVGWFAKGRDLERFVREAADNGVRLGGILTGSRRRPDGTEVSWQFTDPRAAVGDGIVPLFIDWGQTPHPAANAAQGARLVALRAEHPDSQHVAQWLAALNQPLPLRQGQRPALIATIEGPRGRVELR